MSLNVKQEKFVEAYVSGMDGAAAYIAAGYAATGEAAATLACRALKRPAIEVAIEARRKNLRDKATLTRNDIVGFLCETITTPVGKVTPEHRLAQEYSEDVSEFGTKLRVKMPAKLEAIKILNQMLGWNAPEEIRHTMNVIIGGDAE